jgi:two-component system, OmpR family, sensor histidine kinase ChvG
VLAARAVAVSAADWVIRAGRLSTAMALNEHERPQSIVSQARDLAERSWNAVLPLINAVSGPLRDARRIFQVQTMRLWRWMAPWLERQPLWRLTTQSIGWRIASANLVGFIILFTGLMIISHSNRWLVDAKIDSLATQARTVAAAIAANARIDTGRLVFEQDRLADAETGRTILGDDAFADIRLAIAPERVAPVLARLIPAGDVRARIYGPSGFLIVDSSQRLQRGQLSRPATSSSQAATQPPTTTDQNLQSVWTRFAALFTRSDLPVYHELGGDRGTVYPEVALALAGQFTRMMLLTPEGEHIVAVAAPIQKLDGVRGAILLSSRPGDLDDVLAKQRRALLALSLIALLASLFASWVLRRTIAGPMRRLSAAAEHVSHSINKQHELPDFPGRRDEVGALAIAFKDMTTSLYRRIEASERFAQDVAHELKNPVAAARSTAESLIYAKSDEHRRQLIDQVTGEMKRLNRLITDVAKASRLDAELALQETEPLDMRALVAGIAKLLNDVHASNDRSVVVETGSGRDEDYIVEGHEGRLGQVLTNLIDNAASFSAPGGEVRVRIARSSGELVITVDDDGPGIPADRLEHVFKRFYSDRPQSDRTQSKNSGLGLSISKEIVHAHGGRVWAENRMAVAGAAIGENDLPELKERRIAGVAGARFTVVLPAAKRA